MRLTEFRKAWIAKEVRKCADQLGIPDEEIPRCILTRKEWLDLPKELTKGKRTITHKIYGTIQTPNYTTMFLNVRKHRNLRQIRKTIIRELWHCRFRDTPDRNISEKRIELILKGRRFPRKGVIADITYY